jgi:uncharacterized protein (TIGR00661 family)
LVKNQEYPMITKKHLAIIAPLDWGLGHTIRCIPIIRQLQQNNFVVIIACNSNQKIILQAEFPNVSFVHLSGYGLSYGRSGWKTVLKLIFQLPNILIAIKRENLQFKRILRQFTPNIIISDNRYGVFSSSIKSIFITHQLKILTGAGGLADRISVFSTHKMIGKFTECWIPDFDGSFNLAGILSHPVQKPAFPIRYIGPLSRFEHCNSSPGQDYILIILSGPEPQRSILESILLNQLPAIPGQAIVVRGLPHEKDIGEKRPGKKNLPVSTENISLINFADSLVLNKLICDAKVVICRCGYTSVMDLFKLGKKAILIPTPGQAEQEYLGRYLGDRKFAVVATQEKLNISESLELINTISLPTPRSMELYKEVIDQLGKGENHNFG